MRLRVTNRYLWRKIQYGRIIKRRKKALMHTLFYTEQWLKDNLSKEKVKSVIAEMKEMGG